jgi:hypothetical protein
MLAFAGSQGALGAGTRENPAASALPGDAVAVVAILHPDRLLDQLYNPRVQDYLKTVPAYRKAIEGKNFREIGSVVRVIASQLGTSWDKGLKDLTGGGALVVLQTPKGKAPVVSLVITARDPSLPERALAALLKVIRKDASEEGKRDPIRVADHRGVKIYNPADQPEAGLAIVDGKLVVSSSALAVRSIIDGLRPEKAPSRKNVGSGDAKVSGATLVDSKEWRSLSDSQKPDTLAFGFVKLPELRKLDPKRFGPPERPDTGQVFFFGSWLEAFRHASLLSARLDWGVHDLSATVELAQPAGSRAPKLKGYLPGPGNGAAPVITPRGTIASLSLWRDWSAIWDARADLFTPEAVQNLAQLDTFAGQFFGGREFGADVLGALDPHWQFVIAQQDFDSMKPAPDVKLPAFAIVAELNAPEGDFAHRLKIAFQTLVAISNVDAVQKKAVPLELGSEDVEGITLATSTYVLPQAASAAKVTPQQRYNFSPSAASVGRYFILSSSRGLARKLIKQIKAQSASEHGALGGDETLVIDADGPELARLLELNRDRMAIQTMLSRGETKQKAQEQVDALLSFLRFLGHGRLAIEDDPGRTRAHLKLRLEE